jgi:GNAT superfamily N-acetyltransferase
MPSLNQTRMKDELEFREIPPTDRAVLEKIGRLRVVAWSTEVPRMREEFPVWLDELDWNARHWVFMCDDEPVAAARLSVHCNLQDVPDCDACSVVFQEPPPSPIASMNRLVVAPTFRGKGLSKRLDCVRLQAAAEMGCKRVIVATSSGEHRVRQLVSLGFECIGKWQPPNDSPGPAGLIDAAMPGPLVVLIHCLRLNANGGGQDLNTLDARMTR